MNDIGLQGEVGTWVGFGKSTYIRGEIPNENLHVLFSFYYSERAVLVGVSGEFSL